MGAILGRRNNGKEGNSGELKAVHPGWRRRGQMDHGKFAEYGLLIEMA